MGTPQHHIIKETTDTITRLLQAEFKDAGYKRVHVVEEAPKPDAIDGKLPAVSVYLYQISTDVHGIAGNISNEVVSVAQDDGSEKEFIRARRRFLRLDYLVSTWAQTPEDEHLLLGLVIRTVMENRAIPNDRLKGDSFDEDFSLPLQMSARLDEGTLARFWGNLQQPLRPGIQLFTVVPLVPQALTPLATRVKKHSIQYRDLNNPEQLEEGPVDTFSRKDLLLGNR